MLQMGKTTERASATAFFHCRGRSPNGPKYRLNSLVTKAVCSKTLRNIMLDSNNTIFTPSCMKRQGEAL